jgi:hypothetical protein
VTSFRTSWVWCLRTTALLVWTVSLTQTESVALLTHLLEYYLKLITKIPKTQFADLKKQKESTSSTSKSIKFPLYVQYKDKDILGTSAGPSIRIT